MTLTRRIFLSRASIAAGAAVAAPAILHWPANAAEFSYKYGTALPDGDPLPRGGCQDQGGERWTARHYDRLVTATFGGREEASSNRASSRGDGILPLRRRFGSEDP